MSTDPDTPVMLDADPGDAAEQSVAVDADDPTIPTSPAMLPDEADQADVLDQRREIGWGEERETTD